MTLLPYIITCVITVLIVGIALIRIYLNRKSTELSERIKIAHDDSFIDIPTCIGYRFNGQIISSTLKNAFISHYDEYIHEARSLIKRFNTFHITPPQTIAKFVCDFDDIDYIVSQHNDYAISSLLDKHKNFFDTCLKYPLDGQQRRSIVSEEDNTLVVSSAGSGKTSSIVGKVRYLTEIKGIDPQKILLISYTNKAAAELTERIATNGLKGYTFHKLAVDLIGSSTGCKPSICANPDALFIEIYHDLLKEPDFKKSVVEYFLSYHLSETEDEQTENEIKEQLSELKKARLKTVFPDMDGRDIYVRSAQEQKICSALSALGIQFRYEEPYEHMLADGMHSQYRPDFSIYYTCDGRRQRIYLEHFGVDEHGLVPAWFAKSQNMTYEEANRKYNDGIVWKRAAHEKFGTKLLETSSADFRNSDIREKLKILLQQAGVPVHEKTDDELFSSIIQKDSKREKAFIRFIVTFITLVKSNCKSMDEVLQQAGNADDERSEFIIRNIFRPIYERYTRALCDQGLVDFTDVILQATEICRRSRNVNYDYIIVDEFQDISVDRYNFLKALRDGNPPARLYCVGDDWQSIYRFSGSDMALFNRFPDYFGPTEINRIETTYRFGEPLVALSSRFIQRNSTQLPKSIRPFHPDTATRLEFYCYDRNNYCATLEQIVRAIPPGKSIFLLGRYSFDDYYLSFNHRAIKENSKFYYLVGGRKIEFLTVHKSKGLEADYVILLQCNKGTYGFPSMINDDPVLNYVLTQSDRFPYGEERRLFYVAITRARAKTIILYDRCCPSVFVDEFLNPEKISEQNYEKHPNSYKKWTDKEELLLMQLFRQGKDIRYISDKTGRSQTAVAKRLGKLLSQA